jgi:hypothetical protein
MLAHGVDRPLIVGLSVLSDEAPPHRRGEVALAIRAQDRPCSYI